MKRIRTYGLLLLILISGTQVFGQQDAMYSQYMFNGLSINPAYAGSRNTLTIMGLFRRQWLNVPGAPGTQTLSAHTPSRNGRYGFGINLINDQIAYLGQTWLNLSYAFRIPVGPGKLALGIQASMNNYRINWTQAYLIDPNDVVVGSIPRALFLPNAGFGLYYSTKKWYAGASVPHLLINSLDANNPSVAFTGSSNSANLARHYFLTAGMVLDLGQQVKFMPSFLVKYVQNAPMEVDLNASLFFYEKLSAGVSYRSLDGIVGMVQYHFLPQLRAGYAYDFPFTQLSRFTSGSHEIMLSYEFKYGDKSVVSPRFF